MLTMLAWHGLIVLDAVLFESDGHIATKAERALGTLEAAVVRFYVTISSPFRNLISTFSV